jgi:hypothetical protein
MRIGRDHIASTVYTIAFATAGASLSVFLLIKINNRPMLDVLMTERFAAEVLSILVGAIGLVLAVPLTTAVGVAVVRASGTVRRPVAVPDTRRTVESTRTRRPATVKESTVSEQPASARTSEASPRPSAAATSQPTTVEPPRASRRREPAATNGGSATAPESQGKRRKSRRNDDDFGDFTYLHDPDENDAGTPQSHGRRMI